MQRWAASTGSRREPGRSTSCACFFTMLKAQAASSSYAPWTAPCAPPSGTPVSRGACCKTMLSGRRACWRPPGLKTPGRRAPCSASSWSTTVLTGLHLTITGLCILCYFSISIGIGIPQLTAPYVGLLSEDPCALWTQFKAHFMEDKVHSTQGHKSEGRPFLLVVYWFFFGTCRGYAFL